MQTRHFDAVILGGGACGSAAALSLLQGGAGRVAVVERSDFSVPRIGETIPPDANLLLDQLGVTDPFRAQGHLPCFGSTSVWGGPHPGHNDFLVNPHGHGWHLDRSRFDAMLLDQAEVAGAEVLRGWQCSTVACSGNTVTAVGLRRDGAEMQVTGNAYLDATGRAGVLTSALGVGKEVDDRQVVISSRFAVPDGTGFGNSTWLESVETGWWYAACLPGGQAIVALGTDPHLAKADALYDLEPWLMGLSGTSLIAQHLAQARLIPDSLQISASHSYLTRHVAGPNWLAVGDAASGFDPLSSAGIYKAMSNGRSAARTLLAETPEARDRYAAGVASDYAAYLEMKDHLYETEQRWAGSPFWQTRHGAARRRGMGLRNAS